MSWFTAVTSDTRTFGIFSIQCSVNVFMVNVPYHPIGTKNYLVQVWQCMNVFLLFFSPALAFPFKPNIEYNAVVQMIAISQTHCYFMLGVKTNKAHICLCQIHWLFRIRNIFIAVCQMCLHIYYEFDFMYRVNSCSRKSSKTLYIITKPWNITDRTLPVQCSRPVVFNQWSWGGSRQSPAKRWIFREPNGPLYICNGWECKMKPNGPSQVHLVSLYTLNS